MLKKIVAVLVFLFMVTGSVTYAQEGSFSVTPPPIAYPYFEKGKTDRKVTGTYISISDDNFDLKGGGGSYIHRRAFSDFVAIDFQVALFYIGGDSETDQSTTDMNFINTPLSANLEIQPFKSTIASVILFAGPNLNLMFGKIETKTEGFMAEDTDVSFYTTMYGVQGGVQLGFKLGDFHIDPFAYLMRQEGTVKTEDESIDIDAFTTTSFGLDIVYVPMNITLSSILQKAKKEESDSDITIFQLSWHF